MMIVYHGSPHKFDAFDASKIGTGEGAQAYGHGMYFAESPDVARQYQKNVTALRMPTDTFADEEVAAAKKLLVVFGQKDGALQVKRMFGSRADEVLAKANDVTGSLYKVDLPDEAIARMLDWDKPLSQQAPEVKKALNSINPAASKTAEQIAAAQKAYEDANYLWMSRPSGLPKNIEERLAKSAGQAYEDWQQMVGFGDKKGAFIYNQLVRGKPYSAGSEALRQAGIPGIRYLDQGSRGAGAGTSNFVVFPGEEQHLQILCKF